MTVLVTGAGLIGCHTARLLLDAGQDVVLLDNRPNGAAISSLLPGNRVPVVEADICDIAAVGRVLATHRIRRVLHTAAMLSLAFNADPLAGVAVNVLGTVNLLEACRQHGVSCFVFGSSTTVAYSTLHRGTDAPVSENFAMEVVADRPGSFYAASKLSGEFFTSLYADHHGLSAGILRYAAVLGLWSGPNKVRAAQQEAASPPVAGADPKPRWTLKRLLGFVQARFGHACCRETIRAALRRLGLPWTKAKKLARELASVLLGRAHPGRRAAFIEQLRPLLDGAQRDRRQLVYWDEAHIHQDVDLGHGWGERGKRLFVASSSPGLSAKVSFSGKPLGLTCACQVAEHCWDPVGLAVAEHAHRFQRLPAVSGQG